MKNREKRGSVLIYGAEQLLAYFMQSEYLEVIKSNMNDQLKLSNHQDKCGSHFQADVRKEAGDASDS
jgi:hypothetical protein